MKIIQILLILLTTDFTLSANWVVAVAGSTGIHNYGTQSGICHLYQLMIKGGIHPENIILFSFNDVVDLTLNKFPGKLFNKPNGSNVYQGCVIDYSGSAMNLSNYLAVLKGQKDKVVGGSGKVLSPFHDDNVFLSYAGAGGKAMVSFGDSDYLYADQLINTLTYLKENHRFNKLMFYMEASYSGSMFTDLTDKLNVYALASAKPFQLSWKRFCPLDDMIQGIHMGVCLSDWFASTWMEPLDSAAEYDQTLKNQFAQLLKLNYHSTPTQYGDLSFQDQSLSAFFGKVSPRLLKNNRKQKGERVQINSARRSYLSEINYLRREFFTNKIEYNDKLRSQSKFSRVFYSLRRKYLSVYRNYSWKRTETTDFSCYRHVISYFEEHCMKFSDYGLALHSKTLYKFCAIHVELEEIETAIKNSCLKSHNRHR